MVDVDRCILVSLRREDATRDLGHKALDRTFELVDGDHLAWSAWCLRFVLLGRRLLSPLAFGSLTVHARCAYRVPTICKSAWDCALFGHFLESLERGMSELVVELK